MTKTNEKSSFSKCEFCDFECIGNPKLQRHLFNFHSEELK